MSSGRVVERPARRGAGWSGLAGRRRSLLALTVILIAIFSLAYLVGYLLHNANAARAGGTFAIGVVSFLGMLAIGHRDRAPGFDSAEVRVAITTAFVMMYFAILATFVFSSNVVGVFGQSLVTDLTSLFGVVVGFYFASSAVVEYGRVRARGASGDSESDGAGVGGNGAAESGEPANRWS